ncbi:MAG: hypothetical protein KDE58_26140, partial [Caldilineaceae bacterium]|nr:hypothetical protein [Caldilineaceae bacterium]
REALDAPDTVYRVLRGGAYYLSNIFASCTYRDRDLPTNKGRSLGFRVVVGSKDKARTTATMGK